MPKRAWPDRCLEPEDCLVKGVGSDSHLNACIGPQLEDASALKWYTDGFRKAGRRLVDEFIEHGQTAWYPIDVVVYPIVFVYRHHFELLLKLLIREIDLTSGGAGTVPKGHKLLPLWQQLRTQIEGMFPAADWNQNPIIEKLFNEFETVDPSGQTARYPHDTSGAKSFDKRPLLNIRNFADTADRLSDYLESILVAIETKREQG